METALLTECLKVVHDGRQQSQFEVLNILGFGYGGRVGVFNVEEEVNKKQRDEDGLSPTCGVIEVERDEEYQVQRSATWKMRS